MSLGLTERAALLAIVESPDPRVTANERLRAIELLNEAGGSDDDAALRLARWVAGLTDAELVREMAGFYRDDGPPVESKTEACSRGRDNKGE